MDLTLGLLVFFGFGLLFVIFHEGHKDTPTFFSLPRSAIDYIRILIHGLELLVVCWYFVGPIIMGIYDANVAAQISCGLCMLLAFTANVTKPVDTRFARTAYIIAAVFGLLSLPYMFLMT